MKTPNPSDISKLSDTLERLRSQPSRRMRDFKEDRSVYDQTTHQGIYAITDPEDENVVYIGKTNSGTKEKGVADRIWGHLAKGSDLQSSLGIDTSTLGDYNVRTIEMPEPARISSMWASLNNDASSGRDNKLLTLWPNYYPPDNRVPKTSSSSADYNNFFSRPNFGDWDKATAH